MKSLSWPIFPYGGDYNPEQWPEATWIEDADLMVQAGWNIATLPVFGWTKLEPSEGDYQVDWLLRIMDILHSRGIRVCLATSTASVPAWAAQKYPDILVVGEDGERRSHGNRHTFCPSSPNYQRLSVALARKLAETAGQHPAALMVHINNEYGTRCWCPLCNAEFRVWLQKKYGSLDVLNQKWNTAFWSHTYTDWEQLELPTSRGEGSIQALKLDASRFQSEALHRLCLAEAAAFRELAPHLPITTNMMGAFYPLDYREWMEGLDIAAWDSYPPYDADYSDAAFGHVVTRGLREGQPFLLMEQSPSQQNWAPYNRLKPPGQLRLQSWQAVAQGADSVMYFQWRRGRGGCEKLHGAVMEHGGGPENRVFQEVGALGRELAKVGPLLQGSRVAAKVALLLDWPNWWGLSFSSGPSKDLDYIKVIRQWHGTLHKMGIAVEIISPKSDLAPYDVILAPLLCMVRSDDAARIKKRVEEGAVFVGTSFTGLTDENDLVYLNGAPGPLADLFGITVEETDALPPEAPNSIAWQDGSFDDVVLLADRIRVKDAQVMAAYAKDFYAGEPAVTCRTHGEGQAWYFAAFPTGDGLRKALDILCEIKGITSPVEEGSSLPAGVEAVTRVSADGTPFLFLLNHGSEPATVTLPAGPLRDLLTGLTSEGEAVLDPRGVMILTPVQAG